MSMTFTVHAPPATTGVLKLTGEPRFSIKSFDCDINNLEEIIEAIKYSGCVRVKGFLNPEEVAAAEVDVRPALDSAQYSSPDDPTKRLARLPQHSPKLTEKILTDKLYLGVMDRFLSILHTSWLGASKKVETVEVPIVAMSSIFEVGPGMHMQDLHRDDGIWYNDFPAIEPEEYQFGRDVSISFFVAGSRTTVANGATKVIPGSHLSAADSQPDPSQAVDAELDAGDAFFMLSSCYHGAGENSTSDEMRLVYALFMQKANLRQEENFALYLDHDLVRSYPLDVQRRLGYDVCMPNLGWVDHASPLESVLKQKGADKRNMPGYNAVQGIADERAKHSWHETEAKSLGLN
ncbi:hypothetical protein BKA67DRAFT_651727 [Truncatella angustata]|uniref:Fe2OG dioxygenase domain-containing protein n=1 Tax=Truncatella angustata TaxID=152316 RepID=A0A9P8UAY6_9PEZI|nr:uncharacterized protein BKA67DRAFT_651727 [Truncatella angustata]KAH6643350.1 hypothetical protein BKA67DRAFT_651727 [Truncatella angustata]